MRPGQVRPAQIPLAVRGEAKLLTAPDIALRNVRVGAASSVS